MEGRSSPDRFPSIVQDSLIILLFGIVATLILRDRILATTAVGAVVLGFRAAGHPRQFVCRPGDTDRKPFRVGDWVTIGGQEGRVSEITWRATKLLTKGRAISSSCRTA